MEHRVYIKDLISICNAKLIQGDENLVFENLCKDTRIIKNNEIKIQAHERVLYSHQILY